MRSISALKSGRAAGARSLGIAIAAAALLLALQAGAMEAARTLPSIVGSPAMTVASCTVSTAGDLTGIRGPNYTMRLIWAYGSNGGGGSNPYPLANKATTFFFSGTMSTGLYDTIYLYLLDGRGQTVDSRSWTGSWTC